MAYPETNHPQELCCFEALDTKTLESILCQDALLSLARESDTDLILSITAILADRQAREGRQPDVDAAWAEFNRYYLPVAEDCDSLYAFSDTEEAESPAREELASAPSRQSGADRPRLRKGARRMKKRNLNRVAWVVLTIVIFFGAVGGLFYESGSYQQDFVPGQTYYETGVSLPRTNRARRTLLADCGVDLTALPGSHGQTLTFTNPSTVNMYQFGVVKNLYRLVIPSGAQLSCDFVVWNNPDGDNPNAFELSLTVDGKTYDTTMKRGDVAALYRAALQQNGLEEQFQADTGQSLSRRAAKQALQGINRQIYDLGLYAPAGYPYNQQRLEISLISLALLSPVLAIILVAFVAYLRLVREQNLIWAAYNAEHIAHWDGIAGTLPQFTSYAQSGIRGPAQKPRLRDVVRAVFQPVARK